MSAVDLWTFTRVYYTSGRKRSQKYAIVYESQPLQDTSQGRRHSLAMFCFCYFVKMTSVLTSVTDESTEQESSFGETLQRLIFKGFFFFFFQYVFLQSKLISNLRYN